MGLWVPDYAAAAVLAIRLAAQQPLRPWQLSSEPLSLELTVDGDAARQGAVQPWWCVGRQRFRQATTRAATTAVLDEYTDLELLPLAETVIGFDTRWTLSSGASSATHGAVGPLTLADEDTWIPRTVSWRERGIVDRLG